jgi:hypothetical protein
MDPATSALIFLHIPKSGGTTLHGIIERQYPADRIYTVDSRDVRASIAAFKALPEEARRRLQVLKGHMAFGLHAWLPQPSTYITLVRHPVERAISHYYHIRRTPHHTHYATVVGQDMSLHEFILAGVSRLVDNGQVRALAAAEEVPYGHCTAALLERAIAHIEGYFTLVGLTERFDETLVLLRRALGWRVTAYRTRNVGRNRPPTAAVPAATLKLIADLNELDLRLYEYAVGRFAEAMTAYGPDFPAAVARFRRGNTLRGYYGRLIGHLRSLPFFSRRELRV